MNEVVDIERFRRGASTPARRPDHSQAQASRHRAESAFFNRGELFQILSVYSRMVAAGEWRDYAIDDAADGVSFSVFRHAGEHPTYRLIKLRRPRRGNRYVLGERSRVLASAETLAPLLRRLERRQPKLVS